MLVLLVACATEDPTWENRGERLAEFEDEQEMMDVGEDSRAVDDTAGDDVDVAWGDQEAVDSYKSYSTSYADSYATANYKKSYGSSSNPFTDYGSTEAGGNCTNFASQAIMAGLVRSSSASTVYAARGDYDIDKGGSSSYQWYWNSDSDRGPAFTGAKKLYEYAVYNKSTYKGLHFTYVTNDTLTTFLDYHAVKVGDIIFADWEHDGVIDHSMVVTDTSIWRSGYDEIQVTYQSTGSPSSTAKLNNGLGAINIDTKYQALFYVYRPTDYNPSGL